MKFSFKLGCNKIEFCNGIKWRKSGDIKCILIMLITRPEFFTAPQNKRKKQMEVLVVGWKNIWTFFGLLLKAISVRNLAHEVELTESSSCDLFFFCDVIVIVILLLFEILLDIFYYLCLCLFVLFVGLFVCLLLIKWKLDLVFLKLGD